MNDQFETLARRPDIDVATERYQKMQEDVRGRISAELGPVEWKVRRPLSRSGCAEFPDVSEAESRTLGLWYFTSNIPDDKWERAVKIISEINAAYGFGPPRHMENSPGRHEVISVDSLGASYTLGTSVHTTLMLHTGCHLEAKAHPANAGKKTP
ncbi:Lipoprotein [Allokutzneria albata]|uniref:Lipoprotein n=2 Tax=Allokutzneria albata TaxID=211114 RepID=A0A1G9X2T1_ALLAB|nr:Lipoprotein [Allokutzneria albata]